MLRDAIVVAAAFVAAFRLRFGFPDLLPYATLPRERETAEVAVTLAAIWPWCGWFAGLYASRRTRSFRAEVRDVVRAVGLCLLGLTTLAYFGAEVRYSRATLLGWVGCVVPALLLVRLGQKLVLAQARRRGHNLRHVLLVGTGALAEHVAQVMAAEPGLGLRVRGIVALDDEPAPPPELAGHRVVGRARDLAALCAGQNVDQVVVALPIEKMGALPGLMDALSRQTVDVRMVPDFHQYVTLCGGIDDFFGMPMVHLQASPLGGFGRLSKRCFDVVLAGLLALVLAPVAAGVALAVVAEGKGPVLYRQRRIGLDGEPFFMLKFRTMRPDAELQGAKMTAADDPRCTRVGRVLRRLSLDELPQLVNVLRGEMSLVGPRPEQPRFTALFAERVPRYALRHKIKAGMTGWAQVNGLRGNTSIAKRIELDLYYIENWSLLLDCKILLRTALGGFLSPNAY